MERGVGVEGKGSRRRGERERGEGAGRGEEDEAYATVMRKGSWYRNYFVGRGEGGLNRETRAAEKKEKRKKVHDNVILMSSR